MQVQRIKFERTGGFAGMRMATDVKLDELPEEQADSIRGLLDDVNFEELPKQMTSKAAMPDQFVYTITAETDQGEHTVVTDEGSAPEKLKELLQLLNRLARTRKK
jgi:hypothetical protein